MQGGARAGSGREKIECSNARQPTKA
jgi:hypothetical protein